MQDMKRRGQGAVQRGGGLLPISSAVAGSEPADDMHRALRRPGAVPRRLETHRQVRLGVAVETRPRKMLDQLVKPLQESKRPENKGSTSLRCAMASEDEGSERRQIYLSVSVVHRAGLAAVLEPPPVPVEVLEEPPGRLRRSHVDERVALVGKAPAQMQPTRSRIAFARREDPLVLKGKGYLKSIGR